jgi:hypothetical protein
MTVEVAKITKGREAERAKIRGSASGSDPVVALELQYIADTLEAIRMELVGLARSAGTIASKPLS